MPRESASSARRIQAKERAKQALEYRKMGVTFEQIAQAVGYRSKQACMQAVSRALADITRAPAEEVLKLELERLDQMWTPLYTRAIGGDMYAVSRCLDIMARRAKMLGLDVDKTELTGKDGAPLSAAPPVFNIGFVKPGQAKPPADEQGQAG